MANEPRIDDDAFLAALRFTEARTGFSARLIEKDYYCSLILFDLASLFERGLVFKGGTCLSKVHADFFRLSEDLDFTVSIAAGASRAERREASKGVMAHFGGIQDRLTQFQVNEPLRKHNEGRQLAARHGYRSLVTGEDEFVKLEVALREPVVLDPVRGDARTLLLDPDTSRPAVPVVPVLVLGRLEAYAEKVRAALTRREPAIRDYYDLDHAFRASLIGAADPDFRELVKEKLKVAAEQTVDLSGSKRDLLRLQIAGQLEPVLRARDFESFDLDRVWAWLEDLVRLL